MSYAFCTSKQCSISKDTENNIKKVLKIGVSRSASLCPDCNNFLLWSSNLKTKNKYGGTSFSTKLKSSHNLRYS